MIRTVSLLALSIAIFNLPAAAEARSKVGINQAENICIKRVQRQLEQSTAGDRGGLTPSQVNDRYRSCVWAKSGQYPRNRLKVRGFRVSKVPR
ncbi:MAG: hypothetical protein AAF393_14565 [Pseudomonadota bacterium]